MRNRRRSKFQRSHRTSTSRNRSKDYKGIYRKAKRDQKVRGVFETLTKYLGLVVMVLVLPFRLIFLSIKAISNKSKGSKQGKRSSKKQSEYFSRGQSNTSKKNSSKKDGTSAPWFENVITSIEQAPISVFIAQKFKRIILIQMAFVMVFGVIVWKLIDLQITSTTEERIASSPSLMGNQVILSSRGQIYFKDISQSKTDVPLTATVSLAHVYFDAAVLKEQISKNIITLEMASMMVASALNISYGTIYELFKTETAKDPAPKYALITKFVDAQQKKAVEYLRSPTLTTTDDSYVPPFSSWLNFEPIESRFYPENELLAQTVGYVPRHYATREDTVNAGCGRLVEANESRQTVNTFIPGDFSKGQYTIGYYGIEQKFCAELAGLNGKRPLNRDLGTEREDESRVQNGANVHLTIDRNIQRQAEALLQQAIAENTNANGKPEDGSILVMEVETGKVLAMASYPTFDPNNYTRADIRGFRNVTTSGDYEAGSVIKPLTVAAALNEWEAGSFDAKGERLGVPPDWTFNDYDEKGKPYQENNGRIFYIRNSQSVSYKDRGPQNLSNVLRDSINTGIAEIQPTIGNRKTREYFEDRFLFGKETLIDLPGDTHGNVRPLTENINSPFTYATHGFGQGFTVSPIQLARAFTPLANDGYRVEPILVEKIIYEDGYTETYTTPNSVIKQPAPQQVVSENTAKLITGYMVNTVDQGYLGVRPSKGQVPGYTVAGKTGTAEVGRIPEVGCGAGFSVYDCNTSRGIYDHTYVGYGPESDPEIMVIVKLSEPKKGEVQNFAENTTGPVFSQMMKFTLEYLGIPRDR
jgi:cell division protein FtsI/penicillin-binding protein 2